MLKVNLLHSRLSVFVKFEFKQVNARSRHQYHVDTAMRGMHLNIDHIVREQCEDDKQRLLIVPLVILYITIRHRAEKILQQV